MNKSSKHFFPSKLNPTSSATVLDINRCFQVSNIQEVPCRVIFTMRKLKTVKPSLKPPIERNLRSGFIYKIQCPRCTACYVGATTRHVITRFKEQIGMKEKSVYKHLMACDARSDVSEKNLTLCAALYVGRCIY